MEDDQLRKERARAVQRLIEGEIYDECHLISKHSGLFGLQVALKIRCKFPCKKVK